MTAMAPDVYMGHGQWATEAELQAIWREDCGLGNAFEAQRRINAWVAERQAQQLIRCGTCELARLHHIRRGMPGQLSHPFGW